MKKMLLFLLITGILAVIAIVFFPGKAFAQSPIEAAGISPIYSTSFLADINSNTAQQNISLNENQYPSFEEKYSNGLINIASSWAEIPEEMAKTAKEENVVSAGTIGLGKGVLSGIERLVAGTYDLATIPIAPDEKPILKAKYKAENPQEGLKIKILEW